VLLTPLRRVLNVSLEQYREMGLFILRPAESARFGMSAPCTGC
jgi:hypothetical protein